MRDDGSTFSYEDQRGIWIFTWGPMVGRERKAEVPTINTKTNVADERLVE